MIPDYRIIAALPHMSPSDDRVRAFPGRSLSTLQFVSLSRVSSRRQPFRLAHIFKLPVLY